MALLRYSLAGMAALLALPAHTHERWILNPDQAMQLNARPKPDVFTMFTVEGTLILIAFAAATGALLSLHYGPTPRWLVRVSGRARKHAYWVPTILRGCAAWVLLSSAFGMEPQVGTDILTTPSYMAPDLIIADLGPGWGWLGPLQIVVALWLLIGIAAQGAGLALIAMTALGGGLWGGAMLFYAPVWIGVGYYLLVRGGGRYCYRDPALSRLAEMFPPVLFRYPQLVLRICTGLNLLSMGLYFKVMQPNLSVGIITMYEVPILSLAPETFVFVMAMVECCGGLLILAGVLIRVVALALLGAFVFFALFLPETMTAHMLLYGVMVSFLLLGPGRTTRHGRYVQPAHA